MSHRKTGSVKWFNETKGFGFIQPDAGGADDFVHITAVNELKISTLKEGQRLEYELIESRGKTSAGKLRLI